MKQFTDANLQPLNTFGIHAKAKKLIEFHTKEEAMSYFKSADNKLEKHLILGGGSNILLLGDFEGTVLKNQILGIELMDEDENQVLLKVGAGENWHQFVLYCVEKGYAGIENLALIPGNVGASPMQNIGAYGVEVKEVIQEVEAIEISKGKRKVFSNSACEFAYRSSIFKTSHKDRFFITSVSFSLSKKPVYRTAYGAIKEQLNQMGINSPEQLSLKAIFNAVIAIRQSKLPDPNSLGNSGSFFKNPIVSKTKYLELKKGFPSLPAYTLSPDQYKLAAGWLIEQAGWKGFREKDYGVHAKQALVLVNYGNAKGKEIYELSERIIQSIRSIYGVELEREVNLISS